MTTVVDTSVLIDHLRGRQDAIAAFTQLVRTKERIVCSVVTKVEVLAGMLPREERETRLLLDSLEWLPVDDRTAERAGSLARQYLRSHPGVDPVDYIIAATAELHAATLWTRNLKHFPMFAGLVSPY